MRLADVTLQGFGGTEVQIVFMLLSVDATWSC